MVDDFDILEKKAKVYMFRELGFMAPANDNKLPFKVRLYRIGTAVIAAILIATTIFFY